MSNKSFICVMIPVFVLVLFSCHQQTKSEAKIKSPTPVPKGQKYLIDTTQSVLTWNGSMVVTPNEKHTGYVYISKGQLIVDKGKIVGGTIVIDMSSIEYGDKENNNTPVMHLKSADYFDVEQFPTSIITITAVEPGNGKNVSVTGDLTIKGVTRPVTFPAELDLKDRSLTANGKLTIDRTEWGIRYRSGRFFDKFADQIVSDNIDFIIKIVAKNENQDGKLCFDPAPRFEFFM